MRFSATLLSSRILILATFLKVALAPLFIFTNPEGQSEIAASSYVIDGVILTVLALNFGTLFRFAPIFVVLAGAAVLVQLVSTLFLRPDVGLPQTISSVTRLALPLTLAVYFLAAATTSHASLRNLGRAQCAMIILVLLSAAFLMEPSVNRGVQWWGAYMGGLHTTAYVFAATIFFFALHRLRDGSEITALLILVFGALCLMFGWGVRSVAGSVFIFIIGVLMRHIRMMTEYWIAIIITTLSLALVILSFYTDAQMLSDFSSGRTVMYVQKLQQIYTRPGLEWIIGSGVGSDIVESEIWWWDAKGSHNDVLTIIVEGGVILLGCFVGIFAWFFRNCDYFGKLFLIALLFTSVVSNGFIVRPSAAYIVFLAFALFASSSRNVAHKV